MPLLLKTQLLRQLNKGKSPEEARANAQQKGFDDRKILKTLKIIANHPHLSFSPELKKYLADEKNLKTKKNNVSIKNYESIIREKFQNGETAKSIFEACKNAGIPVKKILYEFHEVAQYTTTKYYEDVLNFLASQEKKLTKKDLPQALFQNQKQHDEFLKTTSLWDPSDNVIRDNFFSEKQIREWNQIQHYKKNPLLPHNNLAVRLFFTIVSFVIGFFLFGNPNFWELVRFLDDSGIFLVIVLGHILIFPGIEFMQYYKKLKHLEIDGVKMLIAQDQSWFYSPNQNNLHALNFHRKFHEFFSEEYCAEYLSDEFWGKFHNKEFWIGDINHESSAIAVKLNRKLSDILLLTPSSSSRSTITGVESNLVSKSFDVTLYKNKSKTNYQSEVIKKLSPFVQDKMFRLLKSEGKYSILFKHDCVIFLFPKRFLESPDTNFLKKIEIAESDKIYLKNKLETILTITHEFGKYLK